MKYLIFCLFVPSAFIAMNSQKNYETKQKIVNAVSEHLLRSMRDPLNRKQPYLDRILKSSYEKVLMASHVEMYPDGDQAHIDYDHQRYSVTTKNPRILKVYTIAHDDVSQR